MPTVIRQRVRARFAKTGDMQWLGHQDLARAVERILRRAGVKLSMTEGFHPRARISYPLALAVGISGMEEVLEFDVSEELELDQLRSAMLEQQLPGLQFSSIQWVPAGEKKAVVESIELRMGLPDDRRESAAAKVAELLAAKQWPIQRAGRRAPLDVRNDIVELQIDEQGLRMRLEFSREATARPREILAVLGLEDLEHEGFPLTRTAVQLRKDSATAEGLT